MTKLCVTLRGAKNRSWGYPSGHQSQIQWFDGEGIQLSLVCALGRAPGVLSPLAEKTLSAPKAVASCTASLLLPRYHCVISHFCHITEKADEITKIWSGP